MYIFGFFILLRYLSAFLPYSIFAAAVTVAIAEYRSSVEVSSINTSSSIDCLNKADTDLDLRRLSVFID